LSHTEHVKDLIKNQQNGINMAKGFHRHVQQYLSPNLMAQVWNKISWGTVKWHRVNSNPVSGIHHT